MSRVHREFLMSPGEILADLRKQPFEPFKLHITDGTTHEIRHPDQCLVLTTAVIVGTPTAPDSPHERSMKIDCRHIVKLESLPPLTAGTNGTA